ncbi:hypothetical protein VIGAN_04115600 [Vigna angularis var. angularis]|uniref:Uncharacterized protein n=1 Tax=Vigna angularis var. angularis TaxID=157739 RepID=A0A0S3RTG8_PHAAN|nr:hypothetical protein VIGAN_04115600 [Vigna angularis var. angularis]
MMVDSRGSTAHVLCCVSCTLSRKEEDPDGCRVLGIWGLSQKLLLSRALPLPLRTLPLPLRALPFLSSLAVVASAAVASATAASAAAAAAASSRSTASDPLQIRSRSAPQRHRRFLPTASTTSPPLPSRCVHNVTATTAIVAWSSCCRCLPAGFLLHRRGALSLLPQSLPCSHGPGHCGSGHRGSGPPWLDGGWRWWSNNGGGSRGGGGRKQRGREEKIWF